MANKDYNIHDPITGDSETFATLAAAKKEAKKKDYTPVFIDIYDWDEANTIGDVRVDNPGKREV